MGPWLIIPCFNEAERLSKRELAQLLTHSFQLILVDDGSKDASWALINQLEKQYPEQVYGIRLEHNQGKAEAIRIGINYALGFSPEVIGYLDADFAVPASEMIRLYETLQSRSDIQVLLGSRWLRLGAEIKRSAIRHYISRIFATFASRLLRIPVYDTQCGAKLFRVSDSLRIAIDQPFVSRWAFDVELIGRLLNCGCPLECFLEVPLNIWTEKSGSKMGVSAMTRSSIELISIGQSLKTFRLK
ncbi:MAG: glycosyltransferase [Gammaproteobacteria bacterium]|jgi:dolichyl-phosphate beta-glucosyltransferase|nr:glycosyltransferase [Gammaproteobacteria bacterium]MBT7369160.1 glycosyltransferase [Gammaproteobacteria bacterium]